MIFLSSKETAEKWGIDQSRVLQLARDGRIEGARLFGRKWMIPENAEKPADGRRKGESAMPKDDFRFPLFVNFKESDYFPPLSNDESRLRQAQLAFQECRFEEAEKLLCSVYHNTENRYVRLSAMYHLLYVYIYSNSPSYDRILSEMLSELITDFPHRNEMMLMRYGFDADNMLYQSILDEFFVSPEYIYHPSAYYTAILVSIIPIQNGDFALMKSLRYETYELLCQQMEYNGCFLEAQKLHYLLSVVYQLKNESQKMKQHIKCGLDIALRYRLYFSPALYAGWYPRQTKKVLKDYPADFAKKIINTANTMRQNPQGFEKARHIATYINFLSGKELEYAYLANQGYTNREIAKMHKVSEKNISKIYGEIYEKLKVHSKKELIDLINSTYIKNPAEKANPSVDKKP
ncbi:MAG TPA: hypothetical protein DDY98_07115 [Ruminococcaceae bacterium]|nr:hypothetical protein [Oscillospiraceae bacterium]